MFKTISNKFILFFICLSSLNAIVAHADPYQGYNNIPPPQNQPVCAPANMSSNTGTQPGTYSVPNPGGGYNQVYTTGDKQPYMVDNTCNQQQPIIQPYISNQPPQTGSQPGSGSGSGSIPNPVPLPHPLITR